MASEMSKELEVARIKGVNWIGLYTLIEREINRFIKVYMQTIVAPIVTTLLFFTVFALAFGGLSREIGDVPYMEFLAPGLVIMSMVQNAFSNTSSSLVIAKVQGNIVDLLMPPLSNMELLVGFITGAVVRGLVVGLVTIVAMSFFVTVHIYDIGVIVLFGFLGTLMMSLLGMAGGIWSEKFDHIAAVTNFIVMPLTFLSGTFYSVEQLPGIWQGLAHYNPFFYMIDGFRSGFIGQADSHIGVGIAVLVAINVALGVLVLWMLRTGYKIKS